MNHPCMECNAACLYIFIILLYAFFLLGLFGSLLLTFKKKKTGNNKLVIELIQDIFKFTIQIILLK
jgi:hypothetical protein